MANRVAFALDLNGPSFFLDTACSSSLVATHLAIRSIEAGDCDAAVITGCQHNLECVEPRPNLSLPANRSHSVWHWILNHEHGIISTEDCRPFDSAADG